MTTLEKHNIEVNTNKRRIALFMGAYSLNVGVSLSDVTNESGKFYRDKGFAPKMHLPDMNINYVTGEELKYDTSWSWIMPVWLKILKWGSNEFGISWTQILDQDQITLKYKKEVISCILVFRGTLNIKDVFNAVVDFIDWYEKDQQKQK